MMTCTAPRDAASNPSAPVPAHTSTQRQPLRSCPSQLKMVSRTRSAVGRSPAGMPCPCATGNLRRFHCPPMMRTDPGNVPDRAAGCPARVRAVALLADDEEAWGCTAPLFAALLIPLRAPLSVRPIERGADKPSASTRPSHASNCNCPLGKAERPMPFRAFRKTIAAPVSSLRGSRAAPAADTSLPHRCRYFPWLRCRCGSRCRR